MSETPKAGDKVRVVYEGVVQSLMDGTLELDGYRDFYIGPGSRSQANVEILERADDPSKDPVGTLRKSPSHLFVKTGNRDYPWYGLGMQLGGEYDIYVRNYPVVGVVPGSPAEKSKIEFYQSPTTELWYRVQGDKTEFFATDGLWYSSFVGAGTVRSFTRLDSDPTDGR